MALYRYTDTDERTLREAYPSEALNFNGVFFEDEIKGYRTLNVSGREAMESEISSIGTNARHGERFRGRRYLPRVITVRYQLVAQEARELIEKFNRLNYLLDAEEATLIFNDEPDKYFTGTCRNLLPPSEGELVASGSFELYCADPFKYSVEQYEVRAIDGAITTHYRGTVPNPPVFRIRATADTGHVEFMHDAALVGIGANYEADNVNAPGRSKIIFAGFEHMYIADLVPCIPETVAIFYQIGYEQNSLVPQDTEYVKMQTTIIDGDEWLIPLTYPYNTADIIYPDNSCRGINFWEELVGQNEDMTYIPPPGPNTSMSILDDYDRYASSYQARGTGLQYWLAGNGVEKPNFTYSFESRIYSDNPVECGAQSFVVYGEGTRTVYNDNDEASEETYDFPIFGLGIRKTAVGTSRLEISVYVDGNLADTIIMSSRESNEVFGKNSLPCSLSRFGKTCSLRLGNETYTYTSTNPVMPTHASVYVCDYVGLPAMACNAVRYVRYEEQTAKTANGIINIIRAGDEVVIDCASADIRVNGISKPGMGDIANQWDAMDLEPGDNNIAVITVADEIPEVVMEYREAYI